MSDSPDLFGEFHEEPSAPVKAERDPADLPPASMTAIRSKARLCDLGCGALIVFAATVRKMRGGVERPGWMPVDIDHDPREGNIRLVAEGRGFRAYVLNKAQRAGRTNLHRSHMMTCPNRDRLSSRRGSEQ